jgi:hypothetical protein
MKKISTALIYSVLMANTLSVKANATNHTYSNYPIPQFKEHSFEGKGFLKDKNAWSKIKRKLASEMSFSNSDLSPDYQHLRDEWLKVKTGDEMEALLKKSLVKYNSLSDDTKYFLAQLHTMIPLRGIVWKARPLFENTKGLLGNKSTHVTAVQLLRTSLSSLKTILPTNQTDAAIEYFTEPSIEMSKKDQFQTVTEFQNFLMREVIPQIQDSINKLELLSKEASDKVFIWDNKMTFGHAAFEDEIQRFKGHGAAEMNFTIASLYRSSHDILVYCAYNQDYSIKLLGEMGSHLGVDSSIFSSKKEDFGLTDQERVKLIKDAIKKHRFLELRNYQGTQYGSSLMKQAYVALKNSTIYAERSFDHLQGHDSSKAMTINPILFQNQISPNLDKGIKNMKAVVSGLTEVRDPISGETVTLNIATFYKNPLHSLGVLLPTKFEIGEFEKNIKNKKGEILKVRNYLHGRSIAWDNNAWKTFVPSAEGKDSKYMSEARRIIQYSLGTSMVFGLPNMFVD